jgi:hypothetical protein
MRSWLTVAFLVAGISMSCMGQQNDAFSVQHAAYEKAPKSNLSAPGTPTPTTASTSTSKDLQNLEQQTAKVSASRSAGKSPGTAPAPTLSKDKPNPPINFGGTGAKDPAKTAGMTKRTADPLAGRLKQKSAHN